MLAPADGSIEFTVRRLVRWSGLAASRAARVDYRSEVARLEVVRQLGAGVQDVVLDPRLPAARQVERILSILGTPEDEATGAVSIAGLEFAFPSETLWADAMQVLNVNRENFARAPRKHMWWIPQHLLGVFVRSAPDLDSWFDLKLTLAETPLPSRRAVEEMGMLESAGTSRLQLPNEARASSASLLERARRELDRGGHAWMVRRNLIEPAVRMLRAAGLEQEAAGVEREFMPVVNGSGSVGAPPFNLPAAAEFFTGRRELLSSIADRLGASGMAVLTGVGGIGKTQLALRYAELHREQYACCWLVRAGSSITLGSSFAALASALQLPEASAQDQNEAIRAALARLRSGEWEKPWLLIFDDAASPDVVAPYLIHDVRGHVLITTRESGWRVYGEPVEVSPWSGEDAVQFLRSRLGPAAFAPEPAASLAGQLGGLPLALDVAASHVLESGVPLGEYSQSLSLPTGEAGALGPLKAVWNSVLRQLGREAPASLALLEEFAYLAPDDIPLDLLLSKEDAGIDELVGPLVKSSMAVRNGDDLSIPRLAQAHIRVDLQRRLAGQLGLQNRLSAALSRVSSAFPYDEVDPATWPPTERLLPHALAVCDHAELASVDPAGCCTLLNKIGLFQQHRGLLNEARTVMQRSLQLAERLYGSDQPNVAVGACNLALILQDLGDLPAARALAERALRIGENVYGFDHPKVAIFANNLARILIDLGDLTAARALVERALRIDEVVYGPDHPNVAIRVNNLGQILKALGDLPTARVLTERALRIDEEAYGPDHPSVATRLNNLGRIFEAIGDLPTARAFVERALRIGEKVYGPDHPKVAIRAGNLSQILKGLGNLPSAREHAERALRIDEKVYGHDHPRVAISANNLATIHQALGDLHAARRLAERVLRIDEAAYGPDHPEVAAAANNLATILKDLSELPAARALTERALRIAESIYGPDHPYVAIGSSNLARILQDLGDRTAAHVLATRALDIFNRTFGPAHPNTRKAAENLRTLDNP